jgi:hypothetical protein
MFKQPKLQVRTDDRQDMASPQGGATRGLAQIFGLAPRAAFLAVLVDLLVFTGDTLSLETLLPLGIGIAGVLGFIVYRIQRHSYGDDHHAALTKALIVGLLTAIPVPITPFFAIPGGLLGIANALRRK